MATYTETPSGGIQISGTPGTGIAVRDAFTDATGTLIGSHAPTSGGTWALHASYSGATVAIGAGNTVTMTAGTPGLAYLSDVPSSADYDVSCSLTSHITALGTSSYRAGVAGRIVVEANTFYRAKWGALIYDNGDFNAPGLLLEKVVAGTATQLGSTVGYSGGRITLRMRGSSISVLEGATVKIGPITDASIVAAGKAGVWFEANSGALQWVRLDDFAADGSSQLNVIYSPPAGGGIEAAASAGASFTFKPGASGGVQLAGNAVPSAGFSVLVGSGGVQLCGSAQPTTTYTLDPSGGLQLSGSAGGPLLFVELASGGIQLGGSAAPSKTFNAHPSGGIQLGGSASFGRNYVQVASGGVQLAGSAAPTLGYMIAPSGGLEVSGHAGPPDTWSYLMSGGIEVGGSSAPLITFNYQPSGGLQVSGTALGSLGVVYTVTASGGLQVGGSIPIVGLGYAIYANAGDGGPIDYDHPIAQVDVLTYTTATLAAPGVWKFGVRASKGGLEEKNLDASVRVELLGSGADVSNLASAPIGLSAWPAAGGVIRVTWGSPTTSTANPTGFNVYIGVGSPDYGTAAATRLAGTPTGSYGVDLTGLADGATYAIGVRSYNATGEEKNTTTVTATADATGPGPVDGLTISTDPGDW